MSTSLTTFTLDLVGSVSLPEIRRIVLRGTQEGPEPGRIYTAPVFSSDAAATIYSVGAAMFGDLYLKFVPEIEVFAAQNLDALASLSPDAMYQKFGEGGGLAR